MVEVYRPTAVPGNEFNREAAANRYGDPKNITLNLHRYRMLQDSGVYRHYRALARQRTAAGHCYRRVGPIPE